MSFCRLFTGVWLLLCCSLAFAQAAPRPGQVAMWLTTGDAAQRLQRQPDLHWSGTKAPADADLVVDETQKFQVMEGYGASIVDPSIWNAAPAVRHEVMEKLFSRTAGIGLNVLRVPMGDLDIHGQGTTYDDMPVGQADTKLTHFSMAADQTWKIPFVQEAKRLNPEVTLVGTPWSAPAWMKDGGDLGRGKLKPEYYPVYADYFCRWIQGWQKNGLTISAVTLQNEPHNEPSSYQGMRMEPSDEAALAEALGPRFQQAGIYTHIWCWDHNFDEPDYPIKIYQNEQARHWIQGAAFHAYAGEPGAMSQVHAAYPDKPLYMTELTGTYTAGDTGPQGFGDSLMWQTNCVIAQAARNWAQMSLLWKIGITETKTIAYTGDRPVVRIAPDGKSYELEGEYYVLGHASKFVRPGAHRIASTEGGKGMPATIAFQNPDGTKVLIVYQWGPRHTFTISDKGRFLRSALPEDSVATFVWNNGHNHPSAKP